jgi:hypothetical protein
MCSLRWCAFCSHQPHQTVQSVRNRNQDSRLASRAEIPVLFGGACSQILPAKRGMTFRSCLFLVAACKPTLLLLIEHLGFESAQARCAVYFGPAQPTARQTHQAVQSVWDRTRTAGLLVQRAFLAVQSVCDRTRTLACLYRGHSWLTAEAYSHMLSAITQEP